MARSKNDKVIGTLDMKRDFAGNIGTCDFCPRDIAELMPDEELVLQIGGEEFAWNMCDYHEGEMLLRLVNNFVKRHRKDRPGGYKGPFLKEDVCDICFDLLIPEAPETGQKWLKFHYTKRGKKE
jgi:hypothetical protein